MSDEPRWMATIWYRTENGLVNVDHYIEEIEELHNIVERGPHWDTVNGIVIKRINHVDSRTLTVEAAERL